MPGALMRVWRSELYADWALQIPCIAVYVKAADFVDAIDLVHFAASNFAIISFPSLPVEVDRCSMAFPQNERVRFIPTNRGSAI
jgi:hypothetical protein